MKFEEALVELRKGKTIKSKNFYIRIEKDSSSEVQSKYENFSEIFRLLFWDKWEVEESGKTFPEVFEEFKEGKKIRRKSWFSSHYIKLHDTNSVDANIVDLIENDWEVIND